MATIGQLLGTEAWPKKKKKPIPPAVQLPSPVNLNTITTPGPTPVQTTPMPLIPQAAPVKLPSNILNIKLAKPKPSPYPKRKWSDPFTYPQDQPERTAEYKKLEERELRVKDTIAQFSAASKTSRTGGNLSELTKITNVKKALSKELTSIRALKRALQGELVTKYIQLLKREPNVEDAKHFLTWQKDQQDIMRENVKLFGMKADTLNKVPGVGQGKARPYDLDVLMDVERKIKYNETASAIMSDLQKHRKLMTRKEVEESIYGDMLQKHMKNRIKAAEAAALSAGNIYPEEVKGFLGKDPSGFEESLWNRPWKWPAKAGGYAMKGLDALAQGLAGGVLGEYEKLVTQLMPESEEAKAILEKRPWIAKSKVPLLEGFGRGLNDPFTGEENKISQFMTAASQGPGMGGLRNKYVNPILSLGWSMGFDPLNFIAPTGMLTAQGAAINDVEASTRRAFSLLDTGRDAEAIQHIDHAYDVARTGGLIDDLGDTLSAGEKLGAVSNIKRAATSAERIQEGQTVGLGLRSMDTRRVAADLPDWLRNMESKAMQPFSTAMSTVKGTPLAKSTASMGGMGAKPLMTEPVRDIGDYASVLSRRGAGAEIDTARDIVRLSKGVDLSRVDDILRARPIENITDAEQTLADYIQNLYGKTQMRGINAGIDTHLLTDFEGTYQPGVYRDISKETTRDLLSNLRSRVKPGETRIKTYAPERFTPEQVSAIIYGRTGISPKGDTVKEMLKDLKRIRGETGEQIYGKQTRGLPDIVESLEGKPRMTQFRGRWAPPYGKPTRIIEGGIGETAWPTKPKLLTQLEQLEQFGPTAGVNPARLAIERTATEEARLAANALRKHAGETYGPEYLKSIGYSTSDIDEMRRAGRLKEMEWVEPNLFPGGPKPYAPMGEGAGTLSDDLIEQMTRLGLVKPRGLQYAEKVNKQTALVFSDVADEVESILSPSGKSGSALARSLGRKHDKLLNFWKGQATAMRPGFHGRNYLSNIWQLHLNNAAADFFSPKIRQIYRDARTGRNLDRVVKLDGKEWTIREISDMLKAEDVLTSGRYMEQGTEIERLIRKSSGRGQILEGLSNLRHPLSPEWGPVKLGRWAGRNIENKARGIDFLSTLKQTGSPALAGDAVGKFLFNYDELSKIDRSMRRWGMPFWTWQRKNIPLQIEMLQKQPQKFHHLLQALGASREMGLEKFGKKAIEAGERVMPSYMKDMYATLLPFGDKNKPLYLNPNIPPQDLMRLRNYLNPFSEDNAADVLFQFNPLFKTPASLMINAATKGDMLGTQPTQVPPWLGKGFNLLDQLTGKKPGASVAKDPNTGLPTWFADPAKLWTMKNLSPFLSDLIGLTQTSRTDMPFQRLSRLAGVKILPYDAAAAAKNIEYEESGKYRDVKDWAERVGIDLETEPYKNPPMQKPVSPSTEKKLFGKKYGSMPLTQENLDRLMAAQQEQTLYSPMPWGTLEDVKNAGKKGYIYSYNRPNMTPEQIAAAEAMAAKGGGRGWGGGGYWGSGRRTSGRIKKVKTTKVKIPTSRGLPISGLGGLAGSTGSALGIPPLGLPAAPNLPNQPNSLQYMVNMLSGAQTAPTAPAGGLTHTTGSTDMGLPPDMAASLQQIMSAFFAQNGGPTPQNLAAFQAMMQQQGISSPQIMALIQSVYNSMVGASVA